MNMFSPTDLLQQPTLIGRRPKILLAQASHVTKVVAQFLFSHTVDGTRLHLGGRRVTLVPWLKHGLGAPGKSEGVGLWTTSSRSTQRRHAVSLPCAVLLCYSRCLGRAGETVLGRGKPMGKPPSYSNNSVNDSYLTK